GDRPHGRARQGRRAAQGPGALGQDAAPAARDGGDRQQGRAALRLGADGLCLVPLRTAFRLLRPYGDAAGARRQGGRGARLHRRRRRRRLRLTVAVTWSGKLYRALNPVYAREPLSGRGAELYGGRFNPKGMPALYASTSVLTALREANQV